MKHLTVAALVLLGAACSDHTTMVEPESGGSGALPPQGAVIHALPGTAADVAAAPQPAHPTAALASAAVNAWITGPNVVRSGDWCVWKGHHDGDPGAYDFDWSVSGSVNNWFPDYRHVWANSNVGYVEISLTLTDSNSQVVGYAKHGVDVIYDPWGPSCPLW